MFSRRSFFALIAALSGTASALAKGVGTTSEPKQAALGGKLAIVTPNEQLFPDEMDAAFRSRMMASLSDADVRALAIRIARAQERNPSLRPSY